MNPIHWPSVAVGAAMCACMIYAVYVIYTTLRHWVGHHKPLDNEPTPETVPVATLIESARKIVEQDGSCYGIECHDCPFDNPGCGDKAEISLRLAREYLASHGVTP